MRSRVRGYLSQFWLGFTELSRTAFLTMVVAVVLTASAMLWFFSPSTLSGSEGDYAARSAYDAEAFVTLEAMRLAAKKQDRPRLLLFGSSTLAQSLGDPRALEDLLGNKFGAGDWDVHMLAAPLQTRLDQLTLIQTILANRKADDPPVVIAIGIGAHRLGFYTPRLIELEQTGRLGIRSDWADGELAELGAQPRGRSRFYVFENLQFVVNHMPTTFLRFILRSPAERRIAAYAPGQELPVVYRPRDITRAQIENGRYGLELYARFMMRLHDRLEAMPNVHLIFVDERLSPDFLANSGLLGMADLLNSLFATRVEGFGAPFIEMMKETDLSPADYYDDYHIKNGEPQRRVRESFAKDFVAYIQRISLG